MIIQQTGAFFGCINSGEETINAHFLLLYSKYTDLIETFMFVLRKKQSQVSFLHVYHHMMVIVTPTLALYVEPGETTISLFIFVSFVIFKTIKRLSKEICLKKRLFYIHQYITLQNISLMHPCCIL